MYSMVSFVITTTEPIFHRWRCNCPKIYINSLTNELHELLENISIPQRYRMWFQRMFSSQCIHSLILGQKFPQCWILRDADMYSMATFCRSYTFRYFFLEYD
jgi:hypothetical protein